MDLKTRKLRGFGVRNWADLELLLNCLGLRVDFKERQELFSKTAGRRGMFESGPLDRDLRARV